jgi:cobalt-zinc-cadmium efflux system protein
MALDWAARMPHVHDVHDLHIWTVTSSLRALSAHVVVDDSGLMTGTDAYLNGADSCAAGRSW